MTPSVEEDDGEGEETTLYFDAEEGTLRTADGAEVSFEDDEDQEEQEEENEDGNRTPQPAAESAQQPQRITSMPSH